jgi:hypothetical protein
MSAFHSEQQKLSSEKCPLPGCPIFKTNTSGVALLAKQLGCHHLIISSANCSLALTWRQPLGEGFDRHFTGASSLVNEAIFNVALHSGRGWDFAQGAKQNRHLPFASFRSPTGHFSDTWLQVTTTATAQCLSLPWWILFILSSFLAHTSMLLGLENSSSVWHLTPFFSLVNRPVMSFPGNTSEFLLTWGIDFEANTLTLKISQLDNKYSLVYCISMKY